MLGFQECCDAVHYADAGSMCLVRGWASCWFEFRALGSTLLNALMYPYGLAPLSHILLLAFSILLVKDNQQQKNPSQKWVLSNILAIRHDKKAIIQPRNLLLKTLQE